MNGPDFRASADALIVTIVLAKAEAGRLGLWKTMHALDAASTEIGWELASRGVPVIDEGTVDA